MTDPNAIADAIDPRKQGWSDAPHPLEVYQVAVNDGIAAADLLRAYPTWRPINYELAQGTDKYQTAIYQRGDVKLIWVNEADLYDGRLQPLPSPPEEPKP
jgi:hypothetical protein